MPTAPTTAALNGYGASGTSFYTDVERKDSYESLDAVLTRKCADPHVRQIIVDMLDVCAEITVALRSALVHVEGTTNDFGDTQLSVDVRTSVVAKDSFALHDNDDLVVFKVLVP